MRRILGVSGLALAIFGCSHSAQLETGYQTPYMDTLHAMGLAPVFPPREDFQVGDIFLVAIPTDDHDPKYIFEKRQSVWVGHIERLSEAALIHVLKRRAPYFGSILEEIDHNRAEEASPSPQIPVTKRNIDFKSLPRVNFPAFSATAASAAQIAGALPSGAGGLALRAGEIISIYFPDLRSYGLPDGAVGYGATGTRTLQEAASADLWANACPYLERARYALTRKLRTDGTIPQHRNACDREGGTDCAIHVVTQVYLGTEVQFSHSTSSSGALGLSLSSFNAARFQSEPLPVPQSPIVNVTVDASSQDEKGLQALTRLIEATKLNQGDLSGSGFGMSQGRVTTLSFLTNETNERPIAFAYASMKEDYVDAIIACNELISE